MNQKKIKQVLVWRGDLQCRKGKIAAQISHSSLGVVLKAFRESKNLIFLFLKFIFKKFGYEVLFFVYKKKSSWDLWLNGRFTKVCVYCDSEKELLEIYHKAQERNIPSVLITDAGLTEFHGVPTNTCIALGPFWSEEIDKITGHLKLL